MSNAEQPVGDHQQAAQAANDDISLLAAAVKLAQQASQPPRKVSAPEPLKRVSHGAIAEARYHPPLSLDPRNVEHIEGFQEHAGYLQCAVSAFSIAHVGLQALSDARQQVKKDPSKTEAQAVLILASEAEKLSSRITRAMDNAYSSLQAGIKHNEEILTKPLKSAADNSLSAEVRAYCKNLPNDGARLAFLEDAMKRDDMPTLASILGAQPFLSGIKDYVQREFTRRLHEKNHPELAARIKAMKAAQDLIGERGNDARNEVEVCLGAKWSLVDKLRKTQDAVAQALLLINQGPVKP